MKMVITFSLAFSYTCTKKNVFSEKNSSFIPAKSDLAVLLRNNYTI